ncbi:MAG: hypothetical protein NTV75_00620 [Bacteroidia bacterium]|nr:hypothetical protein [Bacteroidia bacterium]
MNRDERPAFILDEVHDANFDNIDAQKENGTPQFILKNVTNFSSHQVRGMDDKQVLKTEKQTF